MAYRPKISHLIKELEAVKAKHGDIEVVGYNERYDDFDQVGAEFNDDGDHPTCLVTVEKAED